MIDPGIISLFLPIARRNAPDDRTSCRVAGYASAT
jgi:hypothetical protein